MIVSVEKKPNQNQELSVAIIIAFLGIIIIVVGVCVGSWLSSVLHSESLMAFFLFGSIALVFVTAYKVSKYFGLDFSDDFYPFGNY